MKVVTVKFGGCKGQQISFSLGSRISCDDHPSLLWVVLSERLAVEEKFVCREA